MNLNILKDISPVSVLALTEYFKTLKVQGYLEGEDGNNDMDYRNNPVCVDRDKGNDSNL